MKTIGIIPARYDSRRFRGKVLADLCGKPVIRHVYEGALKSRFLDELVVACDDVRIKRAVESFGGKAFLTSTSHKTGTDRVIEIASSIESDYVINIQGDEPFMTGELLDSVIDALYEDREICMATPIRRIISSQELSNPGVVKVVVDKDNFAIYFSRSCIPFPRDSLDLQSLLKHRAFYGHIGLYGYRRDFLLGFNNLPRSELEEIEELEQLRIIANGYRIKTVITDYHGVGIDTPKDLERAVEILKRNV